MIRLVTHAINSTTRGEVMDRPMILAATLVAVSVSIALADAAAARQQLSPAQPAALTLTREVRIDGAAEDFVNVGWVRVGRDGRMAVSQFQDRLVRFYDAAGKLIGRFGRAGDAPGEFRNLSQAGWFGDSLWVQDVTAARITVIPPSLGEPRVVRSMRAFIRHVNLRLPLFTAAGIQGITPGGTIVAGGIVIEDSIVTVVPQELRNLQRAFATARSFDGYDRFIALVPEQPENYVFVGGERYSVPLVTSILSAGAHDGSRVVIVNPEVSGRNAGTFAVTVIGTAGDTIFTRRHPVALERIPGAEWQKAVDERATSMARLRPAHAAAYRSAVRPPAAYPPFVGVMVGRDGSIWLRGRIVQDERRYLVLDSRGNVHGTFALKSAFTIAEADLTNIWVVEPDADGVPSVVRYGVRRG
jgi:hypothetical protein